MRSTLDGRETVQMAKRQKKSRIAPPNQFSVFPVEELGRPTPPRGDALLETAQENARVRRNLLRRLLRGEGERRQPKRLPHFTKRDLKRAREVVAAYAPHRYDEIDSFIRVKSPPDPKTLARTHEEMREFGIDPARDPRAGRPVDPMTLRTAVAVEFLKSCREKSAEQAVAREWSSLGRAIEVSSIRRDYFKQKRRWDLHRELLWRIYEMRSSATS